MYIKQSKTDSSNHTSFEPKTFSSSQKESEKVFFCVYPCLFLFLILFIYSPHNSYSQAELDTIRVLTNYHFRTVNINLFNNGFGFGFRFIRHKDFKSRTANELDFGALHHSKEERVSNRMYSVPRGYVYGKLNEFFCIRNGYGFERRLIEKSKPGSIGVHLSTLAGITIGLQKPIYYQIIYPIGPVTYNLIDERFNPEKHTQDNIYSKSPFFKGFSEIKVIPGCYMKSGFCFDYGKNPVVLHRIETGLQLEIFLKSIEIMALVPKQHFFFSFFASYRFGFGKPIK